MCHLRPGLEALGVFRLGCTPPPNAISTYVSIEYVVTQLGAEKVTSSLKDILATTPTLRYVVYEYHGPPSDRAKKMIAKLRVIVDASSLYVGVGGSLTPVLSLRDATWGASEAWDGWLDAINIYESFIVHPGWAGDVSRRVFEGWSTPSLATDLTSSTPSLAVGYLVLWGYLGEGIGSYPHEWLKNLADTLKKDGRDAVIDWRVTSIAATPLPALTARGLVIQPVASSDGTPTSILDAEVLASYLT